MTAGNIGVWQKKPGDTLQPGDVLVEIETDKAQMDFEFQEEGVLAKILKNSGEKDIPVGNVRLFIRNCHKLGPTHKRTNAESGKLTMCI